MIWFCVGYTVGVASVVSAVIIGAWLRKVGRRYRHIEGI